jgi:multidrug efflux system outer membrane protein
MDEIHDLLAARIARRRYEVGSSSRFDMIQADSLLAQAEGDRVALIQAREQTTNALTLLVGAPVAETALPLSQVEAALSADLPAGLPSDLLAARPDIQAAEHLLRAADADIGAARAAYFPRIALTGLFGSASTDLGHLFDGTANRQWNFAGGAAAPIFNAGRTRAGVQVARTQRDIAVADYERSIQAAFSEVADALAARRGLTQQVEVRRRVLAALTERSRLAGLRYGSGATAYIEVLDAERDRFTAEQALATARGALLASQVSVYAALGDGADPVEPHPDQTRR